MERFGHIFHTNRVEILTMRGWKKSCLCTSVALFPIYEAEVVKPPPPPPRFLDQMSRAQLCVGSRDGSGQPGALCILGSVTTRGIL